MRTLHLSIWVACASVWPAIFVACSDAESANVQGDSAVGADPDGGTLREDEAEIPCAPRAVLQNVCQECHARTPKNGAPFPLVRRSDVLRAAPGNVTIRELMIVQLERRRMPLAPVEIDFASRETLLPWLRAGAPGVTPQMCPDTQKDAAAGEDGGDAAGDGAPDAEGGEP